MSELKAVSYLWATPELKELPPGSSSRMKLDSRVADRLGISFATPRNQRIGPLVAAMPKAASGSKRRTTSPDREKLSRWTNHHSLYDAN
jgi:hypothetical protein